ncbi:MAG TPA: hypothetical protein VLW65_23560 [Bryobacteraceae bacterium]|nr:hypothetical protein [Bryobacteraceae bacterium]
MNRSSLRFLAVLLSTLIVLVLFAGLDNLPRSVRAEIGSERAALASAERQATAAKDEVTRDVQENQDLFRTVTASQQWPGRLSAAQAQLASAARDMDELAKLEKANRRQDEPRVRQLLTEERGYRAAATTEAAAVEKDAAHWLDMKRQLPAELAEMDRDYKAIHAFDLAPVAAAVSKAETDWPEKKPDLDARLSALRGEMSAADSAWQTSAESRRAAAANDFAHLDFGGLIGAQESLKASAADLPQKAAAIQTLSGQLYNSWDKVLVDMETRGRGSNRSYDQKIRTVTTHLADASAKNGETTSDEQWVDVSQDKYKAMQPDLGMAVEHKPAGKYDFEAERVPQPAGFAYMAPPSQGSNQYGYWEHRDGQSFWVFYGQYALLRDLLFNHSYRPLPPYEWEGYRDSYRSGRTYYGRDEAAGVPKYGTQGTATQDRYSGSTFARSGGFRDSQYASKSGSYRNSPYAGPGARQPGGAEAEPKRFGKFGGGGEPHAAPPPRGFRPAPARPSFRPPSGMGRRFGRR